MSSRKAGDSDPKSQGPGLSQQAAPPVPGSKRQTSLVHTTAFSRQAEPVQGSSRVFCVCDGQAHAGLEPGQLLANIYQIWDGGRVQTDLGPNTGRN